MAGSVYEHLSPVIEGFTGNMQTVFSQLLKINDPDRAANKIAFLKTAINEQRVLADSLMESSKKMGPVSQKLSADTRAYQAAFETDIITPQPQTGSTLQGFTLIFFIISFFSLAIIMSILVNQKSGSVNSALFTFGMFIIVFIIAIYMILRLS
jgi:hypothetical protein